MLQVASQHMLAAASPSIPHIAAAGMCAARRAVHSAAAARMPARRALHSQPTRALHSASVRASMPAPAASTTKAQVPILRCKPNEQQNGSSSSRASWIAAAALLFASSWAMTQRRDAAAAAAAAPSSSAVPHSGRSVYAFGSNLFGTLGLGDQVQRAIPTLLSSLQQAGPLVQLVAAGNHAGAVGEDGRVWTWGSSVAGVLGHEVGEDGAVRGGAIAGTCTQPTQVEALAGHHIIHLALSETHAAAVEQMQDGSTRVWTWGTRALGVEQPVSAPDVGATKRTFGRARGAVDIRSVDAVEGSPSAPVLPQVVPLLDNERVVSVACGLAHTLALTSDGRVFAFGSDRDGAMGMGDRDARVTPTLVTALEGQRIVGIAAGNGSSLFVTAEGGLLACGANDRGQAGTGATKHRYLLPVPVTSLRDVSRVSSSAFHACALDTHGSVYSWGWNNVGQCGVGNRNLEHRQPLAVQGALAAQRVVHVSAGFGHTGAVTESGKLYLWGRGREGQLGRGDQLESIAAHRDSPVEVPFFSTRQMRVLQVATGTDYTLTLVEQGPEQANVQRKADAGAAGQGHPRVTIRG